MFMINHWIFAWHYLQAAATFRLSFTKHSIESLHMLQKRRKLLNLIGAMGHVIIIVTYSVLMTDTGSDSDSQVSTIAMDAVNLLFNTTLTVACLTAMLFIHKNQKQLEQHGIYANKALFKLYSFFWLGLIMTACPITILRSIYRSTKDVRLDIAI